MRSLDQTLVQAQRRLEQQRANHARTEAAQSPRDKTDNLFSDARFTVVGKTHPRNEQLKMFADRMPNMDPKLIGIWMSHIETEDLMSTYDIIDKKARHFGKYWNWCFNPNRRKKRS